MRQQFIETAEAKTRKTASKIYPWACRIVRIEGGWMCFESESDYRTWKGQK